MSGEDERRRAQKRSRAWKARRAELDAAIAASAEDDLKSREAAAQEIDATYHGGWRDLVKLLIVPAIFGVCALLVVERLVIEQRVANCFDIKHPQNYGCADLIASSFWAWLLPADMAEEIKAAREIRQ